MSDLERYQPAPLLRGADLDDTFRLAKAMALSKRFPDATTAEQALAKIIIGRELGLGAAQSMIGIYIVEGKPMVAATTLASFVRQGGSYDYRVLRHSDEECAIEFGPRPAPGRDENGEWLPWPEAYGISEFSMEDARRASLVKEKSGWAKFPRNMLYARAMSNGVKWYVPDALHGIPVYHEGEIESGRAVDGVVDGTAVEKASVSLSEVAGEVPAELRNRFYAAYGAAADLGSAPSLLAVRMVVKGQPAERVEEYIAGLEAANAEARAAVEEVTDAEVVPDMEESRPDPYPEASEVAALERRLADLREQLAQVEAAPGDQEETEAELDRLGAEISEVESELAVAVDESQGRLDV